MNRIINSLKFQTFKNIEIILSEKGGLAKSLNLGISEAKNPIIVSLHQDCVPSTPFWLEELIKPFSNLNVVATCSQIEDVYAKKRYTPLLDGKGCAYRKSALKEVGSFDEKTFLNSGEDMDMYLKLKQIGKVEYPPVSVFHYHKGYLSATGYKKYQNANTWGCLFRIYGFGLNGWWKPFFKFFNLKYTYWFLRGFILKRQDFVK